MTGRTPDLPSQRTVPGARPRPADRAAAGSKRPARPAAATPRPTARPKPASARPKAARQQVRARQPKPPKVRRARRRSAVRQGIRLRFGVVLLALALLSLVARLLWLQGFGATAYAAQAELQHLRTTTTPAVRGEILDRDGGVLAETVDARAVWVDPTLVTDASSEATSLAPFVGASVASVQTRMLLKGRFVYLAHGLTPAQGAQVDALDLPGVSTEAESKRIYPDGAVGADVVGFTNYDGNGVAGIEAQYQSQLQGKAGTASVEVDPQGTVIPGGTDHTVAAVVGQSVQLTLDPAIQWEAQQAIAAQVAKYHAQSGMVVVLNPATGQVLADAVAPTFDASDPGAASAGATGNESVSDVYEPGSVNKVIVASAALQAHILTPTSVLDIPSQLTIAGQAFHDAEDHGDEKLTFTGVLAKSSNIGAIEIAQRLGTSTVAKYLKLFGFGTPTGVGLPGESGGDVPPVSTWGPTTAATIPFGQGLDVTAMQVAAAYGAVANNGEYVQPSVVEATIGADGKRVAAAAPSRHTVISASTAATLRTMLEQVTTENGTAPDAAIPGYRIAGKTGTANAIGADGRYSGYTASFVGMAPADHPQLVVEAVLVKPQGDVYGGSVAGPVFQQVMRFALQSEHIAPSNTKAPTIPLGS
jgi:cell division protein FtsI (penicillin-binding protein 3)